MATNTDEAKARASATRVEMARRTVNNFRILFEEERKKNGATEKKALAATRKRFYDRDPISGHPKYIAQSVTNRTSENGYGAATTKGWLRGTLMTKEGNVRLGPNLLENHRAPKKETAVPPVGLPRLNDKVDKLIKILYDNTSHEGIKNELENLTAEFL